MIPDSKMDTEITINGEIKTRGITKISDSRTVQLHLDKFRTDPAEFDKLEEKLKSGMLTPDFNIKFQGFRKRRPEIALLRIAYLLAFSKFGYGFLINPGLYKVREQINNPDREVMSHFGGIIGSFDKVPDGHYLLTLPKELKSFLVIFTIKNRKHLFLLPGPNSPGFGIYDYMNTLSIKNQNIDFHIKHITDAPFLTQEEYAFSTIDLFETSEY